MHVNTSPDTLLIDLDGVIRDWRNQDDNIEAGYGLPAGTIRRTLFEPRLLQQAITGQIDDPTWRRLALELIQSKFPESDAKTAMSLWSQPAGNLNVDLLPILARVRRTTVLILLTNATTRLNHDLARLGLTGTFDHVINSAAVGVAKPDAAIFHHALKVAGSKPSSTVFVDDSAANVAAAARLGIRAHQFSDTVGALQFFATCGIVC